MDTGPLHSTATQLPDTDSLAKGHCTGLLRVTDPGMMSTRMEQIEQAANRCVLHELAHL